MRRQLMKITVIALAGVMMLAGCKKKVATIDQGRVTFTATTGGDGDEGGKTSLGTGGVVLWTSGDQIKVNGTAMTLSSGAGSYSGSFTGTVSESETYVAAYPVTYGDNTTSISGTTVTFALPATQTLTENSFANGAAPMVAKSGSNYLAFRNVCGGIAVRLWATSGTVDQIVVTSKSDAKLNGTYTVDYSGDDPSVTLTSGSTSVITLSGDAVTLSTDSGSPNVFYVMLPVGTYTNGFNVKAYSGEITLLDKDFASVTAVERNRLYLLAVTQVAAAASVTTGTAGSITTSGATISGNNVTADGGATVTERGMCYGTSTGPTTSGSHVSNGSGTGEYSVSLTSLTAGTQYYYRAYAINSYGTVYGDESNFTTYKAPEVTTSAATSIATTTATLNGNLTYAGVPTISEKGFVYSTTASTTSALIVGGSGCTKVTVDGSSTGTYTYNATGLSLGTKYYVRAYAINAISATPVYGDVVEFETSSIPNGVLAGLFSINSSGTQVYFSKGNLQYIGSDATPYWKFADNQYDYLGTTTGQNSTDTDKDRDLFGWGTSGWNNGNYFYQPYNTSNATSSSYTSSNGYGYGPTNGSTYTYSLTGDYANADWGVYIGNSITNGASTKWRTLTKDEWVWVLGPSSSPNPGTNCRESSTVNGTANARFAAVKVNSVPGLLIFPDSFTWDASTMGTAPTTFNTYQSSWNNVNYTTTQFGYIEAAGCVFLPAAGGRGGATVYLAGSGGYYWSTTYLNSDNAYCVHFNSSLFNPSNSNYRYYGDSVRLVYVP